MATLTPERVADPAGSLAAAKSWLRERVAVGARCPCCTQFAKVYRRKLNSGMAACLIILYKLQLRAAGEGDGWLYVPDFVRASPVLANSREYPKLRHWRLVETRDTDDPDKKDSGYWRVTALGADFVRQRAMVPSHIKIYDSRLLGLSGEPVGIADCLSKKFSYQELMSEGFL